MNYVIHRIGTQAQYDSLVIKDADTLYFIQDSQRIYKGDKLISSNSVEIVDSIPGVATAVSGKLYVTISGSTANMYIKGENAMIPVGGASGATIVVPDESAMLALDNIQIGQEVFRQDTSSMWILVNLPATSLDSWQELGSQNDTVWQGTQNKVIFYATNLAGFNAVETKDANTLYFLQDVGKIFKGSTDVTNFVAPVSAFPEIAEAVIDKLYVDSATLECKFTVDNQKWVTLIPGYWTDGANWAQADSGKLATIGVIKAGIAQAIANKVDKVTGTENNVATLSASGGFKDSGTKVGESKFADIPDAYTLATEAAVARLFQWQTIGVTGTLVNNSEEFVSAITNPEISTLQIDANIDVPTQADITQPITINGNGNTVTYTSTGKAFNLLSDSTVEDITIVSTADNTNWNQSYGLQFYNGSGTSTVKNVKLSGNNAGILVNSTTVNLEGTIDVSGNTFGGIEVGKGVAEGLHAGTLNINNAKLINTTETYGKPTIWVDGKSADIGIVNGADKLFKVETGTQIHYYIYEENTINN